VALTVRQRGGVIVEYGGSGVILDPTGNGSDYPVFVSHAHADHAAAFKYPDRVKYATEETYRLLDALGWRHLDNWRRISLGDRVKLDDIEVHVHNAGHVLGSVQFEVNTPEGTVLYTGDIGLEDSYTMRSAESLQCDLLVVETTFGAPMFNFPKRREVALDMVRWALMESIPAGRIPTFKADSIGNAQEIIRIFNTLTKLPVVTAKSATKVSGVYREFGHSLDYLDWRSAEGEELLSSGKCALIAPKGSTLPYENLDQALASGWAVLFGGRRRAFALSDHADFRSLLGFIGRCRPRRVLTFHGGSMTRDFHGYVQRKLGIEAHPLTSHEETLSGQVLGNETRLKTCTGQLMKTVRIPGFEYSSGWLVREMARRGFTRGETESSINLLVRRGVLMETEKGVKMS
jgi:putative mRNA 3-end processing factor